MAARRPPAPVEAPDVVTAAASDDRVATLRAMRDVIARQLVDPSTPARELAALTGRMQSLLAEIAELAPVTTKGTPLDELNARRTARGADPAPRARAGRK